jgi:hypothetical protein
MNSERTPLVAARVTHVSVFAGRAFEGAYWVLAIVLLALYCGARSYGELERRDAFALFIRARSPDLAAEIATPAADRAETGSVGSPGVFGRTE